MSIDTLLEAARYLEWQAQQQQITRGKAGGNEPAGGTEDGCIGLQKRSLKIPVDCCVFMPAVSCTRNNHIHILSVFALRINDLL